MLTTGLAKPDAELIGHSTILSILDNLNEPQILILMSYGNFKGTMGDPELDAFVSAHPGVFDVHSPTHGSKDEGEERRWAMHKHYKDDLFARGLLQGDDPEGPRLTGLRPTKITALGRMLLEAITRDSSPSPTR